MYSIESGRHRQLLPTMGPPLSSRISLDVSYHQRPTFAILALFACIYGYLAYKKIVKRNRSPLPPGPPGEFLLGHYRVVPVDAAFKTYDEWAKKYSTFSDNA